MEQVSVERPCNHTPRVRGRFDLWMSDRSDMIVAHRLSKSFGSITAVDSLEFEIAAGDVVGFLGPNGAGKTTTIRMIVGSLAPSSGRVEVDGLDVQGDSMAVRRRIGYLPESAPVYAEMRVGEFLAFRAKLFGIERSRRRTLIDRAIKRCWLQEVRRRPISQLSRGYRQRVGLAAALLHEPKVIILDEPTIGLDPTQIREVRCLLRELAGDHTMLLSTHLLPEAELSCDRILMIARGRLHAQGTIDELQTIAAKQIRYVVETDDERAEQRLGALDGAVSVESARIDGRWCRVTVTGNGRNPDLREAIGSALAGLGGVTRELRREAPSLEHLFIKMVSDAETELAMQQEAEQRG